MSQPTDFLTKLFWADARERMIRTFVQVLVSTLPVQTVSNDLFTGNWGNLQTLGLQALTAAVAAALSLLWSLIMADKPNTISPASGALDVYEPADTTILTDSDLEESYHPDDVTPKEA